VVPPSVEGPTSPRADDGSFPGLSTDSTAGTHLGGPTRDSLAAEGYEEVVDEGEGGEDAWSLTRRD